MPPACVPTCCWASHLFPPEHFTKATLSTSAQRSPHLNMNIVPTSLLNQFSFFDLSSNYSNFMKFFLAGGGNEAGLLTADCYKVKPQARHLLHTTISLPACLPCRNTVGKVLMKAKHCLTLHFQPLNVS